MKRKQYPVVGVCLASALFLALQAKAQEAAQQEAPVTEATQQEAPVADVTQQSALPEDITSGNVMQMDAITVTATRQEEKILNVPQTINVITRKTMDDHNVTTIEEMVRHTPGVHVDRQTSLADSAFGGSGSISMRGVGGNRILTVVDGDRVMESTGLTGEIGNRMFVDPQMLKSAEIARGPASVLWGADAMGGMVSYQTLDPDDLLKGRQVGGKASVSWDGLNYGWSEHGSFAVQPTDTVQALIGYTHRKQDETRLRRAHHYGSRREGIRGGALPDTDIETNNVLGKLIYRPNQTHQFKLTGEYFESKTDTTIPFATMTGKAFANGGDYREQEQTRWRLAFEHKWDADLRWLDNLTWRVSYSDQERDYQRDQDYTTQASTMSMGGMTFTIPGTKTNTRRNTHYEQEAYQADVQLTSSFDWASTSHRLTYGFQGDLTETTHDIKQTNFLTGVTQYKSDLKSGTFANADTVRADVYIQDEVKLFDDRLTVTPGLRHAHYSLDPTGGNDKLSENKWLPQLGAIFKFNDTYSIYGRYAKGFKMPTASQLYFSYDMAMGSSTTNVIANPDLKPETSDTVEFGFRGKYDNAWFSVGAFYTDYDDFIAPLQQISDDTYTSLNLKKLRIWGIEASGEWQFARNWSMTASADWQYAKKSDDGGYDDGSGANAHTTTSWVVPPLTGVVGLKWKLPEYGVTTELFGTFAKSPHQPDSNKFKPGGYSVFDGYVNWQMTKNLTLTASVTNILNKRYFNYTAAGLDKSSEYSIQNPLELYTDPGRTVAVSLRADF